jgi:hypothetical protein
MVSNLYLDHLEYEINNNNMTFNCDFSFIKLLGLEGEVLNNCDASLACAFLKSERSAIGAHVPCVNNAYN